MFAKAASCCIALIVSASTLFAADPARPIAHFKISDPTGIPGKVLQPGSYTIHIVDHLSDRYIVSVDADSSKDRTLFLGIPDKDGSQGPQGELKWSSPVEGVSYMKGWDFATLPVGLEFAYPKNDAVAVAKANNAQVPAIDPESEGMVAKASLSKDEMHIITLWLLSPTTVGPNSPGGIQAARYSQVASVHKPAVAKLPHTAGNFAWFLLVGVCSLVGAMTLRVTRRIVWS